MVPGPRQRRAIEQRDALEARIEAMPGGKAALVKWAKAYNDGMDESVAEGQCNMTNEGEYCPKHGLKECGIYEYTGNWTNFGLEESDELAQLKKLALGK